MLTKIILPIFPAARLPGIPVLSLAVLVIGIRLIRILLIWVLLISVLPITALLIHPLLIGLLICIRNALRLLLPNPSHGQEHIHQGYAKVNHPEIRNIYREYGPAQKSEHKALKKQRQRPSVNAKYKNMSKGQIGFQNHI